MCLSFRAKKVCYLGTEYRIGAVIQVGYKNELSEFVVVSPSKTYFVLKSIETRQLSHFHAFDVCFPTMPGTLILLQRELCHALSNPLHKSIKHSKYGSYIVTKYNGPKSYV